MYIIYEGDYVAPPYPESVTPSLSVRMVREGSCDITVVYNDKLIQIEGESIRMQQPLITLRDWKDFGEYHTPKPFLFVFS